MRIAYVTADPGVPVFGHKGCSVHVQEVIRALRRRAVHVELHAVRLGGDPPGDLADLDVHDIPFDRSGDPGLRERRARDVNPALLASLGGRPRYDLVYERYSLWGTAGVDFAHATGVPCILEVNAPLVDEQSEHRTLLDRRAAERVARHVFHAATLVLAVSRDVADHVLEHGVDPDRVVVQPNGVDPLRFSGAKERPKGDPFTVGFVGTLKPWHDVDTLIDAFAILHRSVPEARLLVVGDGPERSRLEKRIGAAGLAGATTFVGAVAPDEVPGWLERMHVGVAPYSRSEASYFSPLKVLEYMAAGLPVLGSSTGQIPFLIEDGHSGLLYAPGDAGSLADAMRTLCEDEALRRGMGRAGREAVAARHSWDRVVADSLGAVETVNAGMEMC